jgi:hypothetical protein
LLTWKLVICLKYLVMFWLSATIVLLMHKVDVIDLSPIIFNFRLY